VTSSGYARGRDSEYRAINELHDAGWEATRNAGSHGVADVFAWNEHAIRFIQVKTWLTRKPSHASDIARLKLLRLPPNASAEIWGRRMGQKGWEFQTVVKERQ